jgi:hypothetical protein
VPVTTCNTLAAEVHQHLVALWGSASTTLTGVTSRIAVEECQRAPSPDAIVAGWSAAHQGGGVDLGPIVAPHVVHQFGGVAGEGFTGTAW